MPGHGPPSPAGLPPEAMNNPGSSLKDNLKNQDSNNPKNVIDKSNNQDKRQFIEISGYDSQDVSAYICFKMFTYKRRRQEGAVQSGGNDVAGGAAAGAASGAVIGSAFPIIGTGAGAAVGGAVGAGLGYIRNNYRQRDSTDYKSTIILPLITPISQGYQVNWDSFDSLLNGELVAKGAAALAKTAAAAIPSVSGVTPTSKAVLNAAGTAIESAAQYESNVLANETGQIFNPDTELVLQSISLRRHSFEFTLTPRNSREKDKILEAIKTFKLAAHPEKTAGGLGLSYPYEFSIYFIDGRDGRLGQALEIPPIPDCACTNIEVVYNPQTVRFHNDGSAGQYRITVSFTEHQTLTRDDIVEGGF